MTFINYVEWLDDHCVEDPELCGYTSQGWYFWDETQSQAYGPYNTWYKAYHACVDYYKELSRRDNKDACNN